MDNMVIFFKKFSILQNNLYKYDIIYNDIHQIEKDTVLNVKQIYDNRQLIKKDLFIRPELISENLCHLLVYKLGQYIYSTSFHKDHIYTKMPFSYRL